MFLQTIKLENILSFKDAELELRPLNVLIGANASGKSNLLRAIGLLKEIPRDFGAEIARGGGVRAWINQRTSGTASIEILGEDRFAGSFPYRISFQEALSVEIVGEDCGALFQRDGGRLVLSGKEYSDAIPVAKSVLSEFRHPGLGGLLQIAIALRMIGLFRKFKTGPDSQIRTGTAATASSYALWEDGGNLAMMLHERNLQTGLNRINESLKRFFDLFSEVIPSVRDGIAQFYVREPSGLFAAMSLSDGTLQLLCLLMVLLDPDPPSLICIEEPEAGLHPDAIRMIAELLVEASTRTQVIVTTHSPTLVDALTDQPEAVVVCERDFDGFTQFRRLQTADLDSWLERYSLGQLWQKREIGGNRW